MQSKAHKDQSTYSCPEAVIIQDTSKLLEDAINTGIWEAYNNMPHMQHYFSGLFINFTYSEDVRL